MHATVKRICTIDGHDPAEYKPGEPDRFAVALRLFVGPSPGEGEESFDVTICTPLWLQDRCELDGSVFGRHYIVVLAYNFGFIHRVLVKLVERYSAPTWQEVATKVGRIGSWEFEDYETAN